MPLQDGFVKLWQIFIYFPECVCLSLLSGGKWSVWFSFEVACEMICPIRSEELHLLMAAHVFFFCCCCQVVYATAFRLC